MDNPARSSAKKILLLVAILVPIFILLLISTGFAGLAIINPENHGKTVVYPISDQQARLVQELSVYLMAPLAIATGILAILNIKLAKQRINKTVLILCATLIGWVAFTFWALNAQYVSQSDNSDTNQTLKIRSIDLE